MASERIRWPAVVDRAREIVESYEGGVTLRQVMYRLVSEGALAARRADVPAAVRAARPIPPRGPLPRPDRHRPGDPRHARLPGELSSASTRGDLRGARPRALGTDGPADDRSARETGILSAFGRAVWAAGAAAGPLCGPDGGGHVSGAGRVLWAPARVLRGFLAKRAAVSASEDGSRAGDPRVQRCAFWTPPTSVIRH
jgi:hypothetical protein